MGDDEVIIIEEDCDELEEAAEKALDEANKKWEELYSTGGKVGKAVYKADMCWNSLQIDSIWHTMDVELFKKRARECADLSEQAEELDEKFEEIEFDTEESHIAYKKAKAKWDDCIHEETKVTMRLPE